MEFGVVKGSKGIFKLLAEEGELVRVLNSSNPWDAIEEAENLYPDAWISCMIGDSTGQLMKWKDYKDSVDCGGFTDYDGYGYAYDKDFNFIKNVRPSLKNTPKEAVFVLWFNR